MKIECTWTRDDLRKYLWKKRKKTNIIFLVLGACFFFYITYYGYFDRFVDNKVLLLGFVIYFIVLIILLWLMTALYVFLKLKRNDKKTKKAYGTYQIEITSKEISSTFHKQQICYPWKDITTVKMHKNYVFLATKQDKLGLYFRKEILKDQFPKIKNMIQKELTKNKKI